MRWSERSKLTSLTLLRASMVSLALALASSIAARAATWQNGDEITHTQNDWGLTPAEATKTNNQFGTNYVGAANILINNYDNIYASTYGTFAIGIPTPGYSAQFDSPYLLAAFLPQGGPYATLDTNSVDPSTTSAGSLAGEVAALKLNIDFSAAGITLGNSKIPFGNLVIENLPGQPLNGQGAFNGLTVNQFLQDADALLGGGSAGGLTIAESALLLPQLNGSFEGGVPTTFAEDYLYSSTAVGSGGGSVVSPAPEIDPSGLAAGLTMLLGVLAAMRGRRPLEF